MALTKRIELVLKEQPASIGFAGDTADSAYAQFMSGSDIKVYDVANRVWMEIPYHSIVAMMWAYIDDGQHRDDPYMCEETEPPCVLMFEGTVVAEQQGERGVATLQETFVAPSLLNITINGTTYVRVSKHTDGADSTFGDATFTTYPFYIIMSDSSTTMVFVDPGTYRVKFCMPVSDDDDGDGPGPK